MNRDVLEKIAKAFRGRDLARRDLESQKRHLRFLEGEVARYSKDYEEADRALRALCAEQGVEPGEPDPFYYTPLGEACREAVNNQVAIPQLQPAVGGMVKP